MTDDTGWQMTMLGMKIVYSPYALKDSDKRLFSASRHRSARIRKKLLKRFGGEFRRVPCMYQTPLGLIAHPWFETEIRRAFAKSRSTGAN